jgi:uncharacterized protein
LELPSTDSNAPLFLVKASSLLHDMTDHKYHKDPAAAQSKVTLFLQSLSIDQPTIDEIFAIIDAVSFTQEKKKIDGNTLQQPMSLIARIVQDADRLDAIGAIGIARCLTYGGAFNRTLHMPPSDDDDDNVESKGTTIQHFYDKLLHLKDMMKTDTGKKMAAERHEFMEVWLERFYDEWEGKK